MSGSTSSGPPRGTLLSLADGTAVCFFSQKGLLAVAPADCGAQHYVLRSVDLVVSPSRRSKVGPTELPTVPTECIFTVHHVGENVCFRSVGAEGRILQAVRGGGEHRLTNYNMGPWEQWEHDAQHGLVNVHWRKPLGFGLQTVQTALFDDLKEQERRLLRDARLMGAAVRAAEAREADLLRRVKEAQAAAGGYFDKAQPSAVSQSLQRKLQAAEAAREAAEAALADKSAELDRAAKARARAEAASSDARQELAQAKADRAKIESALKEAEAARNDALKAKERFERQTQRGDSASTELLARVAAAEARAAESERRAAESDKRAAEAERRAAAMQAERDQVLLGAEQEREHVARELVSIRLKAAAVRQESNVETLAVARQHLGDSSRHAAELAPIPEAAAAKPAAAAIAPVPFEFQHGPVTAPNWGAPSVQPTTPLFGAVPRNPKGQVAATGRTPSKAGLSSSKPPVQVGSAAWERALDQVQAIMPTTATPVVAGKEGVAEQEDGAASAPRRRGSSRLLTVGSCLCPGGAELPPPPATAERAPLAPQNGPAPPARRNSVAFADETPQHSDAVHSRAAYDAQQSTSKPSRPPAAQASAVVPPPPPRSALKERPAAPPAAAAAAAPHHYPRYAQPSPGDEAEEEVAERAPQPEDDELALDWALHSTQRGREEAQSVPRRAAARGAGAAHRRSDPDLCTPAVPIQGGQCGFATNIAVVRGGVADSCSVEESAGSTGETAECGLLRAPGSARKRLDMAQAVSEANGDEIDPKNPGECSASTSPLSARGPAAAGRRPAARGFGGWNESIDERGERGEEGLENRPPQQERAQPQVQRGHGLPVRAVPSSSGGSGLSGGGSKGHSGGSGYRAGAGSGTALAGRPRGGEKAFAPVLPGQAKSIGDAMAPWAVPAKRIGSLDADMRFGNSREALQEVSMNDLFMGLWSPGKGRNMK